MVLKIIADIRKALENNLHFVALNSALTLPDICGKAAYPNCKVGDRYKAWYDEFVGKYEVPPTNESGPDDTKMSYLSGEVVYSLRNSFLHQGTPNIEPEKIKAEENKIDNFSLIIGSKKKFDIYPDISGLGNGKIRTYSVNIRRLCIIIGASASAYYKENKSKFNFFNYTIIDWDQEVEKMKRLRH